MMKLLTPVPVATTASPVAVTACTGFGNFISIFPPPILFGTATLAIALTELSINSFAFSSAFALLTRISSILLYCTSPGVNLYSF
jgi:lipoprotein